MQRHSFISITARIISILLLTLVWTLPVEASPANRTGTLVYVVDGDTLAIRIGKNVEKVRLIGIDTPESRVTNRAHRQSAASNRDLSTIISLGKQASKTMRDLVQPGTPVTLEFDVRERDKYGRLLAYAYLPDGSMINEKMLAQGYAQLLTIPPNVKYTERFQAALQKSQTEKRGLWAKEGFKN
jgi:micrococcal nuclease